MPRNKPRPCLPGGFMSNYVPTSNGKKKEKSHEVECNEGGYERSYQKEYLKWYLQESKRDPPLLGPFLLFSIFSSLSAFEGLSAWAS